MPRNWRCHRAGELTAVWVPYADHEALRDLVRARETAWAYQHRPHVTGFLLHRQKNLSLSEEVKKMAWKAQQRPHKRYTAFAVRGKNKNQIVTALGRELLGFIRAIAVHAERQQELAGKAA
jgi:hypothetical protein